MTYSSVNAVIEYWKKHDVPYLPGVSDDDIAQFETKYSVNVPDDFRAFYKATDGTHAPFASQDHESYDFYPLSTIVPDPNYEWAMTFADYEELSWWYGIDFTGAGGFGPGAVYMLGTVAREPVVVALSFDAFLDLYVRNDHRMMQYGAIAYHEALLLNRRGPRNNKREV